MYQADDVQIPEVYKVAINLDNGRSSVGSESEYVPDLNNATTSLAGHRIPPIRDMVNLIPRW